MGTSVFSVRGGRRYFVFVDVPSRIGIHFLSAPSDSHVNVYDVGDTIFITKRDWYG